MIWALMALLGIPIWLIVGVLITTLVQRRRVANAPGVFPYKARTATGWARTNGYARWVSDVVIRYQGVALLRSAADQATAVEVVGPIDGTVKGLGDDVVELRWTLKNRDPVSVAVSRDVLPLALGTQTAAI